MSIPSAAFTASWLLAVLWPLASAQGEPCTVDAAGTGGDCRLLRDCPELEKLARDISDGRTSPRFVSVLRELTSKCPMTPAGWPMVCCQNELTRRPAVTLAPPLCSPLPAETQCGRQLGIKVVAGEDASIGEFPWMASIQYDEGEGGDLVHGCGGTLITSRHVLTAAHCVSFLPEAVRPVSVVLGELDFNKALDCDTEFPEFCADPPIQVDIERIYFHPGFRNDLTLGLPNDIAVLRLALEVNFTDFVQPICLLNDSSLVSLNGTDLTPGLRATVAGWGRSEIGGGSNFTPLLQTATLPIQGVDDCERRYGVATGGLARRLCAGAGSDSADTCRGDSGGPLMLSHLGRGTRWYQAGVSSFGSEDCGQVAGYTRVIPYFDWILEQLCKQ